MNTRANIALLPWWKRILYGLLGKPFADPPLQIEAPKQVFSHEQAARHREALRAMLRHGIEIGMSRRPPVVYRAFCPRHEEQRLHETQPGLFACDVCTGNTGPIPLPQTTEPLQKRPLLAYLEEHRRNPGVDTKEFRTVHLGQRVRQG